LNRSDSANGPFSMESVFMLTFTEDGTKVCKVEEIVDSKYLTEFLAELPKPAFETS